MAITLLKVNCLTDDPTLPEALERRLREVLAEYVDDDPDGPLKARMHFAFKATPFPESYMQNLPKPNSIRIEPSPSKPRKTTPRKTDTERPRKRQAVAKEGRR